jgi:hypothetical protein
MAVTTDRSAIADGCSDGQVAGGGVKCLCRQHSDYAGSQITNFRGKTHQNVFQHVQELTMIGMLLLIHAYWVSGEGGEWRTERGGRRV